MKIADFVLIYNQAQDGLYCSDKTDHSAWNVYEGVKAQFAKHGKVFEHRIRSLLPYHRVIPVQEEESTSITVF